MMPRDKRQPNLGTKGNGDWHHEDEASVAAVTPPTNDPLLMAL